MAFKTYDGGLNLTPEEWQIVNTQRRISERMNNIVAQIPVVTLGNQSKSPLEDGWTKAEYKAFSFDKWVDDEEFRHRNAGFKLCDRWIDIDMDSDSNEYVMTAHRAMAFLGIDNRLQWGRTKRGVPTHVLLHLSEEEAAIFADLQRYVPQKIKWHDGIHHVEVRGSVLGKTRDDARQTAIPGSVYDGNDIITWYLNYHPENKVEVLIPHTTESPTSFETIVRALAFADIVHMIRDKWVEGSRRDVNLLFTGWLTRVIAEATAIANNRHKTPLINFPIHDYNTAKALVEFVCQEFADEEAFRRVDALDDMIAKMDRDPNMKCPGWNSMRLMFDKHGDAFNNNARTVLFPNSEISQLTYMVERYIYNRTTGMYIDMDHFRCGESYELDPTNIMRGERHLKVLFSGKSYPAFDVFEESDLRRQVTAAKMYPNYQPGEILRVHGERVVPDEYDGSTSLIFNTWGGLLHEPIDKANFSQDRMDKAMRFQDQLYELLTNKHDGRTEWWKNWIAQMLQQPGTKPQMSGAAVGGQGVGKSFFGSVLMRKMLGPRLCGTADAKIFRGQFSVTPFIDKLFVLVDEASFTNDSADAIKNIIRGTDINGERKNQDAQNYKIFARVMFSSNKLDLNIGDRDMRDRAMFYSHAVDAKSLGMTEFEFRRYTESLVPFFADFAEFLEDVTNVRHLVKYYMEYDWDMRKIMSLEHSAGQEEELMRAAMPLMRKIIIAFVERGGKTGNPKAWMQPVDLTMDKDQLDALRATVSQYNTPVARIMEEMTALGLFSRKGQVFTPIYKWGDALSIVQQNFGVTLEPIRSPEPDEFGKVEGAFMPPPKTSKF